MFCGWHLLAAKLRPADIDASAGSIAEVERIVRQIRAPLAVHAHRADSGFAREALTAWCEQNPRELPVRARPQNAPGRHDRRRTCRGPRGSREDRLVGSPLQRFPVEHAQHLSRRRGAVPKTEWTKGEAQSALRHHLAQAQRGGRAAASLASHATLRRAQSAASPTRPNRDT